MHGTVSHAGDAQVIRTQGKVLSLVVKSSKARRSEIFCWVTTEFIFGVSLVQRTELHAHHSPGFWSRNPYIPNSAGGPQRAFVSMTYVY